MKTSFITLSLLIFTSLSSLSQNSEIDLNKIRLPENYHIEVYVSGIENPRALDFAEDSTLFAGSRRAGYVYAITTDKKVIIIDSGLHMPAGVDYHNGDLYVSAVSRILKYPDIINHLDDPPGPVVINDRLPREEWHGWKFIKIGPDNKLYVPVGAACNVCDSTNNIYGTICRMNLDGSSLEIFAEGVRNTVGFDWNPDSYTLWFTDNGRDLMGDDIPPDELNKAPTHGMHFGFPYVHGKRILDPEFWMFRPYGVMFAMPEWELPAHCAAIGMRFYTGEMFEDKYKGGIFITEHGSWDRTKKSGYRISFITIEENKAIKYEVFATGWMNDEVHWGRPADVLTGPDGALYVSDDYADCIYRIYYEK